MEQDAVLRISHSDEGYGIIARKRVRAITGSREPTIEDYHAALVQCLKDKAAEIERLRLTDAEREAIDFAWCSVGRDDAFNEQHADGIRETLEQLLERTRATDAE